MSTNPAAERTFWDAAARSANLRDEWLCDARITDDDCRAMLFPPLADRVPILDLGCGIGRLTVDAGCDISPAMLAQARPGPDYRLGDGRSIPWPDDTFGAVFSFAMFQHVDDTTKAGYLAEIARVLVPGGRARVQYVVGDERVAFSQQTSDAVMLAAARAAGLEVLVIDCGRLYPQWSWLTAERPA